MNTHAEEWSLPDAKGWSFENFLSPEDVARVGLLERARDTASLVSALSTGLASASAPDSLSLGWEFRANKRSQHRAVVQFRIDPSLFDIFFNARTGYRAHFRAHPTSGLDLNATIISALREILATTLTSEIDLPEVDDGMKPHRMSQVTRDEFLTTLDPDLAKLWFGATPIGGAQTRAIAVSGPKIRVGSGYWASLYMEDAWLELKGAFLTGTGLCQPKKPMDRAKKMHETGEA